MKMNQLLNNQNFKMSGVLCTKEFLVFAKYFGYYNNAYDRMKARNFSTVEDGEEILRKKYEGAVNAAINKLFALNAAFKTIEGVDMIEHISTFEEKEIVLETIFLQFC